MSIIKKIRRFIHRVINNQQDAENPLKKHAFIGNSHCEGINLRLDNPQDGHIYLTIGNDSIVSGSFIFESDKGHISIGDHTYIGASTFISRNSISVGENVLIAWGCTIYDHDSHSLFYEDRRKDLDDCLNDINENKNIGKSKNWSVVKSAPIVIKDDAWIGMNVIILKGVTIGRGAIVGAGSVVTKDVPDWSVVAGNPARVVKQLTR